MTEDQDNAGDIVASTVRVALTAAGQLAEQVARRREADLREAERESVARVATLRSQLAAERELALRSVRDVVQRGDAATVEEVMRTWEQARSWDAPAMTADLAQLEEHIRERFGVDARSLGAQRSNAHHVEAVALVGRDVQAQLGDKDRRDEVQSRVARMQAELVGTGVSDEAASASALWKASYPIPADLATGQRSRPGSWRPRLGRRSPTVGIEGAEVSRY